MTEYEKLSTLKTLLSLDAADVSDNDQLMVYLSLAKAEILSWLYSGKTPENIDDVPAQYEPTQLFAVVAGYGLSGAENQTTHSENGISRTFKYEDMVAYIRSHIVAYVQVV